MKVSIILPTYNEKDNIGHLIDALDAGARDQAWETEILVVDDNSPDGTAEVARDRALSAGCAVRCFVRTEKRGLATAILYGIRHAGGDLIVVMDTDFNHDPGMIPQMVKFLEYYDLIIGSRFVMGGGMEDRRRYFYSLLFNMFIRSVLRLQIQDNLSGFFAIRCDRLALLDQEAIFQGYGEYFIRLIHTARRRGYRMLEIPAFYRLRRHGVSKSRFVWMILNYTRCVFSLRFSREKRVVPVPRDYPLAGRRRS